MDGISISSSTSVFLSFIVCSVVGASSKETLFDTMERQCGGTINLSSLPTKSLVLLLTSRTEYTALFDCHVTVVVTSEAKIHLSFLEMNVLSFGACTGDFLTVLDSEPLTEDAFNFQDSRTKRYCGTERPGSMASTGNNMTIRFVSDANVNGRGFSLLLTAFHEAVCSEEEFRCGNNRCIDNRLKCDDYDNCGDGSDTDCHLPVYLVAGIAVVSILVLLAGLFLIVVLRYRCRQKQFESEESLNEDNVYDTSNPIRPLPVMPVRYPAVTVASGAICAANFITCLTQMLSYDQLFMRPQHLSVRPYQNNEFVST